MQVHVPGQRPVRSEFILEARYELLAGVTDAPPVSKCERGFASAVGVFDTDPESRPYFQRFAGSSIGRSGALSHAVDRRRVHTAK